MAITDADWLRYYEAIEILYQENFFCIENLKHLDLLLERLPKQHINAIRHLSIESECWRAKDEEEDGDSSEESSSVTYGSHPDVLSRWQKAVENLTLFRGLRTLHVFLVPFVGLKREKKALEDPLIQADLAHVKLTYEFRPKVVIKPELLPHFPQWAELLETAE